jgi:ATP-dependent Lon protease
VELPSSGGKETVTAAVRAGWKRLMLPSRNRKDYDDIPEQARRQIEFVWLERVDDAVAAALEPAQAGEGASSSEADQRALAEADA